MSTPLDTDARARDDMRAVTWIAVTEGFGNVTMRKIATRVGISQGTLASHLRYRAHVLRVACGLFTAARTADLDRRFSDRKVPGLLPATDADLSERWRLRQWLTSVTGGRADDTVVDGLNATLQGLRAAMCRNTPRALDLERAQSALETAAALARSSFTMASGSSAE